MEEKILDELLKDAYTLEEFRKKYQVFKKGVEAKLYHKDDSEQTTSEAEGESMDKLVSEIKSGDFVRVTEYIEDFMRNHEALAIYFVFMPEKAQIKDIGNWLRTNLKNPRQIFQVKVDPALIGGCAIAYKGVYKDYSLKAKIAANKEKIVSEFRKNIRQ